MKFCFQQTALSLLSLIGKRKIGYKGIFVYLSFWNLLSVIYAMLNLMYRCEKGEKIQPASVGIIMARPGGAVTLI